MKSLRRHLVLSVAAAGIAFAAQPAEARFLESDPVGYKDQMNLYGYVGNDPLNKVDPTGLYECGASLKDQRCTDFLTAQNTAKSQLQGSLSALRTAKANLAAGKLTASDSKTLAAVASVLGVANSRNAGVLDKIISTGDKIMGALNSSIAVEYGGASGSAFFRADTNGGKAYDGFFSKSAGSQASMLIHEGHHTGTGSRDFAAWITYPSGLNSHLALGVYGRENSSLLATSRQPRGWTPGLFEPINHDYFTLSPSYIIGNFADAAKYVLGFGD